MASIRGRSLPRVVALVALLVVAFQAEPVRSDQSDRVEAQEQLTLFLTVLDRVRGRYVEERSNQELVEAAIHGVMSALDPNSSYLTPKAFEDVQARTDGEFGGLGIEVTMDEGHVRVVSPIDGSPADKAGIRAGDLITHLDGAPVTGLSLSEAVAKMRGEPQTDLTLTVRRGDGSPFDVTVTRDIVQIRSVRGHYEHEGVGYVRIATFSGHTASEVEAAIEAIELEASGRLEGVVLDLRNNPGGLFDQGVAVADLFIDEGEIVSVRGRAEGATRRHAATSGDLLQGRSIVVLVNEGSASSAEIVAGALQDHGRAVVLGTTSFGKGSVQTVVPLPDRGALRLTTSLYYTPSGRSIEKKGIDPDIAVERDPPTSSSSEAAGEADRQLAAAVEQVRRMATEHAERPDRDRE